MEQPEHPEVPKLIVLICPRCGHEHRIPWGPFDVKCECGTRFEGKPFELKIPILFKPLPPGPPKPNPIYYPPTDVIARN